MKENSNKIPHYLIGVRFLEDLILLAQFKKMHTSNKDELLELNVMIDVIHVIMEHSMLGIVSDINETTKQLMINDKNYNFNISLN